MYAGVAGRFYGGLVGGAASPGGTLLGRASWLHGAARRAKRLRVLGCRQGLLPTGARTRVWLGSSPPLRSLLLLLLLLPLVEKAVEGRLGEAGLLRLLGAREVELAGRHKAVLGQPLAEPGKALGEGILALHLGGKGRLAGRHAGAAAVVGGRCRRRRCASAARGAARRSPGRGCRDGIGVGAGGQGALGVAVAVQRVAGAAGGGRAAVAVAGTEAVGWRRRGALLMSLACRRELGDWLSGACMQAWGSRLGLRMRARLGAQVRLPCLDGLHGAAASSTVATSPARRHGARPQGTPQSGDQLACLLHGAEARGQRPAQPEAAGVKQPARPLQLHHAALQVSQRACTTRGNTHEKPGGCWPPEHLWTANASTHVGGKGPCSKGGAVAAAGQQCCGRVAAAGRGSGGAHPPPGSRSP